MGRIFAWTNGAHRAVLEFPTQASSVHALRVASSQSLGYLPRHRRSAGATVLMAHVGHRRYAGATALLTDVGHRVRDLASREFPVLVRSPILSESSTHQSHGLFRQPPAVPSPPGHVESRSSVSSSRRCDRRHLAVRRHRPHQPRGLFDVSAVAITLGLNPSRRRPHRLQQSATCTGTSIAYRERTMAFT